MFHRVSAGLGLMIVISLGLSGCFAPEDDAGSLGGATSADPAERALTQEQQADDEALDAQSETGAPETSAPEPSAQNPSACLIGDWVVSESELQGFYDTVNASQATFSIAGDMRLSIAEDTYQFLPDFALTLEISGIDAVGEIQGEVNGSYTADEEVLTTSYEDADNVDFVITVMGQEFDGREINDTFLAMFAINESPYTCEQDALTIGYQNVDGEAVVPVQFTRNG